MNLKELFERTDRALKVKDYDTALSLASRMFKEKPDSYSVNFLLGTIFTKKENFKQAVRFFKLAQKLEPEDPGSYNNLAVVYRRLGQKGKARHFMELAWQKAPERADIAYNLGNFYKSEGEIGRASCRERV